MKKKRMAKRTLLLLLILITFAVPVLSGTGGLIFQPKQVTADAAGAYDKNALDFAAATAFEDARASAKMEESDQNSYDTFYKNIEALTSGKHWGNVGLFIGPRATSKNVDNISTLFSSVTVDEKQMQTYDGKTGDAFSKYKAFGTAMQKLNAQSLKKKGASSSLEQGLNEVSAAAGKLTNLGTNLIKQYNPAPLVLAMVDNSELSTHPDNKLVEVVNGNENLREMFSFLGSKTGFGIPWSYFLTCLIAFLLLVTSVLMTLFNGRSAGENIRKMIVKIVIGCVAVPLIAKGLDWGINFLGTTAEAQANTPNDQYVSQNLNLADWYATGFSLPNNLQIEIDQKGRFVLQPSDVKAINEHTYRLVTGQSPSANAMKNRMEEAHVQLNQALNAVSFSEPIRKEDNEPWRTATFYRVLEQFGKNESWDQVEKGTPSEVGYLFYNGLNMSGDDNRWTITGTGDAYGISPIAATNMMRTTFSSASMAGNLTGYMGGVAFDVDNGENLGDAHMNAIIRFLATFALVMAAMKGLFSIITAGFGGILGGSAKGALGSSAGLGQALGGVLALVGGVFGVGIIMTMSFTLLDQVYGIVCELFKNTTGGTDLLEPLADLVADWPFGSLLSGALKSVASFLITLFCAITLPKFGGIPVTLFCQYLSELPQVMAERAQQMENKFTGDFRAGGGRMGGGGAMGSAGNLFNQAANSGKEQMKAIGKGASMVGGALLGLGAAKAGSALHNALDKKEAEDASANSMSDMDNEETLAQNEDGIDPMNMEDSERNQPDVSESMDDNPVSDPSEDADSETGSLTPNEAQSDASMTSPDAPVDSGDGTLVETVAEGSDIENEVLSEDETMSETKDEDNNDSLMETNSEMSAEQSMASEERQEHTQMGGERSAENQTATETRSMADQKTNQTHGMEQRSDTQSISDQNVQSMQQGGEARTTSEQVHDGTVHNEQQKMAEQSHESVSLGDTQQSIENTSAEASQMQTGFASVEQTAEFQSEQKASLGNVQSEMPGQSQRMSEGTRDGQNPVDRTPQGGMNSSVQKFNSSSMQDSRSSSSERNISMGTPLSNPMGQPTPSAGNGSTRQPSDLSKAQQQKKQAWRRTLRGVANGLEAASAGKSTKQRVSEITAGMTHMAGGYTGTQNMTSRRVDAVRKEGQRQRDIRDNLGPQYTRNQEKTRQNPQRNGSKPMTSKQPTATRQPIYNPDLLNQYEQQRWEEQRQSQYEQRRKEPDRREDARRANKPKND